MSWSKIKEKQVKQQRWVWKVKLSKGTNPDWPLDSNDLENSVNLAFSLESWLFDIISAKKI